MGAARYQRKHPSNPERHLWNLLRGKSLGVPVRRQYPIIGYIAGFYVHQARLVIETDSPLHNEEDDRRREAALGELGIWTHRVTVEELTANDEVVFDRNQGVGRSADAIEALELVR